MFLTAFLNLQFLLMPDFSIKIPYLNLFLIREAIPFPELFDDPFRATFITLVIDSGTIQSYDCPNWHNAVISVFRDKQFLWCSNSNWKKSETMANCFWTFFYYLNPRAISEMLLDFCLQLVWWGSKWGAWFLLLENGLCSTYLVVTIRGFQIFENWW